MQKEQVRKYKLAQAAAAKWTLMSCISKDTVMAFKQRNKLGRFSDAASTSSEASEKVQEQASKVISIGDRCEVQLTDDADLRKRGCVRFIGI